MEKAYKRWVREADVLAAWNKWRQELPPSGVVNVHAGWAFEHAITSLDSVVLPESTKGGEESKVPGK